MTAAEIIALRTGATAEAAAQYAELAADKVREYLRYEEEDSVDQFKSTVADIGVLYYQRDADGVTLRTAGTGALKSESFSEGGVSVSKGYMTAGDMIGSYDARVDQTLHGIARYRRVRIVRDADADAG